MARIHLTFSQGGGVGRTDTQIICDIMASAFAGAHHYVRHEWPDQICVELRFLRAAQRWRPMSSQTIREWLVVFDATLKPMPADLELFAPYVEEG
jgi:hypothetical protein